MIASDLAALATISYGIDATRSFLASSLGTKHSNGINGSVAVTNGSPSDESTTTSDPSVSCLAVSTTAQNQPLLAAQLNSHCIYLLDLDLIKDKLEIRPAAQLLRDGVVFSPSNPFHLWIGDVTGVGLYDVRMHRSKPSLTLTPPDELPLASFDVNADETLLAAGCELGTGNSGASETCLLVWDIRGKGPHKIRDQYADSHTDEVSAVKFHPSETHSLVSGGTDGLVNIFDLNESCEEDAIQMTLKIDDSTPSRLRWDPSTGELLVICEDGSFQVINDTDVDPVFHISPHRDSSSSQSDQNGSCNSNGNNSGNGSLSASVTSSGDGPFSTATTTAAAYTPKMRQWGHVVDTYLDDDEVHVVMSSDKGVVTVWRLDHDQSGSKISPSIVSLLNAGGHKDRVRSIAHIPAGFVSDAGILVSGADDGVLCVWRETAGPHLAGTKQRRESGSSSENGHPLTPLKRVRTFSTNSAGNHHHTNGAGSSGHKNGGNSDRKRNPSN